MAPRFSCRRATWAASIVLIVYILSFLHLSSGPSLFSKEAEDLISRFSHVSARPIDIVLTASASYTIGLYPLINSTLVHASSQSRSRFRFHIVSASTAEASQVSLLDQ